MHFECVSGLPTCEHGHDVTQVDGNSYKPGLRTLECLSNPPEDPAARRHRSQLECQITQRVASAAVAGLEHLEASFQAGPAERQLREEVVVVSRRQKVPALA